MRCRQCGTEIAGKAIVCYRCGTATTDAKFKAPVGRRPQSRVNLVTAILALALLAFFALYMERFLTVGAPSALRWLIAVLAGALIALRVIARRR